MTNQSDASASADRATHEPSPDGLGHSVGIPSAASSWVFEPHGAFRTTLMDMEWPLGYISDRPGEPIFALHEVVGERSIKDLYRRAKLIAAAPELLAALDWLETYLRDTPHHNAPAAANARKVMAKARGAA